MPPAAPPSRTTLCPRRGFTLVELMVVVALVSLLAAVAYPSYQAQLIKSRRVDGRQALLELAQRLERYHGERGTYVGATLGASGVYPGVSAARHYALAITTQTTDGYTITATPLGVQGRDDCGSFGYNQIGDRTVASASRTVAQCW